MPFFWIRKPIHRQNYICNPGGGGSSGYRVVNGTVALSSTRSHSGTRSWLVTPSGAGCYLELDCWTLPNSTMVLSIWASDGAPTSFRVGSGGAATPTRVEDESPWFRYEVVYAASTVVGLTTVRIYVNRATYLDDAQMEVGPARSSALNGDMGEGYYWLGPRWNSASIRERVYKNKLVASGGILYRVDDDERVRVQLMHGVGVPPVRLRTAEYERGDGNIVLDRSLDARTLRFTIWLIEADFDALLRLRAEMVDLLAPKDEVMLITDLGGVPQYTYATYQGGLELGEVIVGNEKLTLTLTCPDSGWTELGQKVYDLTLSTTFTAQHVSMLRRGSWQAMGTSPGAAVRCLHEAQDGTIYAGTLSDGTYGWVAYWTGQTWVKLARVNGGSAAVYFVRRSYDGSKLYVGGSFTTITKPDGSGSASASNFAVVTLSTGAVAQAGGGVNGAIRGMDWDASGTYLYITGDMTQVGGALTVAYAARYAPGSNTWAALGSGLNGAGYAVACRKDGKAIFGGAFTAAGALSSTVSGLTGTNAGAGSLAGYVKIYSVTALDGSNNETARSGTFTADGSWSGVNLSWTAYGGAAKYRVYWFSQLGWNLVYEGVSTSYAHTSNLGSAATPPALSSANGTVATPKIAAWNPTTGAWESFGQAGFDGTVYSLWLDPVDQLTLFAAGAFLSAGNNIVNYLAWSNGSIWRGLGSGANGPCYDLRRMRDGSIWAAVGQATSVGGDTLASGVARWVGLPTSGAWQHLDLYLPGLSTCYAVCQSNEDIIIGHNANGSADKAAEKVIAWPGNLSGLPRLILDGPLAVWGIGFVECAGRLAFSGMTVADGERVTIDLRDRTVVSSILGDVSGRVMPGSVWPEFVPGDNTVDFMATGTGANSSAKVVGYPQYLSVDRAA